ncbi:MAG: hypothetical protein M3T49_05055, partial [Candidatus Eremiobacteraeota bacterium]|nr:hypothetical protein [Candidatus Eremiobacteraeota bacterium]
MAALKSSSVSYIAEKAMAAATLLYLGEWTNPVHASYVARHLNVSDAVALDVLRLLDDGGLIDWDYPGSIALSKKGRQRVAARYTLADAYRASSIKPVQD